MSFDFKELGERFAAARKAVADGTAQTLNSEQLKSVRDFFKKDSTLRGIAISAIGSAIVVAGAAIVDANDGTYEIDLEVAESADGCPVTSTIHQQLNRHMLKNEGVAAAEGYMVFEMSDGQTVICKTSYGTEAGAHEVSSVPESFVQGL